MQQAVTADCYLIIIVKITILGHILKNTLILFIVTIKIGVHKCELRFY